MSFVSKVGDKVDISERSSKLLNEKDFVAFENTSKRPRFLTFDFEATVSDGDDDDSSIDNNKLKPDLFSRPSLNNIVEAITKEDQKQQWNSDERALQTSKVLFLFNRLISSNKNQDQIGFLISAPNSKKSYASRSFKNLVHPYMDKDQILSFVSDMEAELSLLASSTTNNTNCSQCSRILRELILLPSTSSTNINVSANNKALELSAAQMNSEPYISIFIARHIDEPTK